MSIAENEPIYPAVSDRRLMRLEDVMATVRLAKSSIYAKIQAGQFPTPIKNGATSLWVSTEIQGWIDDRIAERDSDAA